jgi:hypothetical protein
MRFFELRSYEAADGKLEALVDRFRTRVCPLFVEHGMSMVGFWSVIDEHDHETGALHYVMVFEDRADAERRWRAFLTDPEWARIKQDTEQDGPLAAVIETAYLKPVDFSPMS